MANRERIETLRSAILRDAREMARAEVEQARQQAAADLERSKQEAEAERARIIHEASRQADALRRRMASLAELKGKRRVLEAREKLITQVLEGAIEKSARPRDPEARRSVLLNLVVEAAREAGSGQLTVQVAPADLELLTPGFLAEASELLSRYGISPQLSVAPQPAAIAGGAIVVADGGRIVVDNSFEARLRRLESTLRSEIWRILSAERRDE